MSRPLPRAAPLLALALLAGCPLPQALPEYPSTGTIAPPRIKSDAATPGATVILVDPACGGTPSFTLSTALVDENTLEKVEVRWFVDYQAGSQSRAAPLFTQTIDGPADGLNTQRTISDLVFQPYDFDPVGGEQAFRDGGGLHVVELVVSNGFAPEPASPRPYRTPATNFETQVFRWIFHYAPGGICQYPAP